ncbi:MAG: hypothetical protein WCP28_11740 [Actinomycetes bacterium]
MSDQCRPLEMIVLFGDPAAVGERVAFTHPQARPTVGDDGDMVIVHAIDEGTVHAPGVLLGDPYDDGPAVVYMGPTIPSRGQLARLCPSQAGWVPTQVTARFLHAPVPVELIVLGLVGNLELAWAATTWLPSSKWPMERFDLDITPELSVEVHVLQVLAPAPAAPPYPLSVGTTVVVRIAEPADVQEFAAACNQDTPVEYVLQCSLLMTAHGPTWRALAGMAEAIQTHALRCLDQSIVASVQIHNVLGIDENTIGLLPRAVRDGLEGALDRFEGTNSRD